MKKIMRKLSKKNEKNSAEITWNKIENELGKISEKSSAKIG